MAKLPQKKAAMTNTVIKIIDVVASAVAIAMCVETYQVTTAAVSSFENGMLVERGEASTT